MQSIWIIKQYGSTPDLPGGIRQYTFAQSLAQRGFEVSFFLSSFHYLLHKTIKPIFQTNYRVEKRDGINLVWIKGFPYTLNNWRRAVNVIDFALRFYITSLSIANNASGIRRPDYIFAFNLPLSTPLCAYFLSRRFRARFFLEVGDIWPQTLVDLGKLKAKSSLTMFLKQIEKYLYRHAENIITPLPFIPEYLSQIGFSDKGVWIGSGEELSNYQNTPLDPYLAKNVFNVMYLGAHGPANDLFNALDAFRIIQQQGYDSIKLILIGDGVDKAQLVNTAHRMKLKNVEFKNAVPKKDVPEIVRSAHAFLFSLKRIGIFKYGINPNKLGDYLCAGRPIIFSAEVRNNIVEDSGCGITVTPGDSKALAQTVIKLYTMSQHERDVMARRARAFAERHLDIENVTDKLVEVLGLG